MTTTALRTHTTAGDLRLTGFEILGRTPGGGVPMDVESGWVAAAGEPGGVHEALIAAGATDPRRGGHERDLDRVEGQEWWFRCRFTAPDHDPGDRVVLALDGLDTIADVWLDGAHLGHHRNRFWPFDADVTERLRTTDEHVLLVRLSPPLPPGTETDPLVVGTGRRGHLTGLTGLRKAAFSWGWDFGPRIPSVGIEQATVRVERPTRLTVGVFGATTTVERDRRRALEEQGAL